MKRSKFMDTLPTQVGLPYSKVRSDATSETELRLLVDSLVTHRGNDQWSWYLFDGREATKEDPDAVLAFHPSKLTSLRHFRICSRNEVIWRVPLTLNKPFDPAMLKRLAEFCDWVPSAALRQAFLYCDMSPPGSLYPEFNGRFNLGVRRDIGDGSQRVQIEFGQRFKGIDLEQRRRFFVDGLCALGLEDAVQFEMVDGYLLMRGNSTWEVEPRNADTKGRNADRIHVRPFATFAQAWERVNKATANPIVSRMEAIRLYIELAPLGYEELLPDLNALEAGWKVCLYGSYADGIDPFTADASQSPDGRFPIFTWSQDSTGAFFQADIVPTPQGRFVEVHSNCGDIDRLLNEANTVTGVRFTPMQP